MRLTLRTMLVYLDDVLEPAAAREIGKKIEESAFASSLVHRTRDTMRRLRLEAPRLERGRGLDPNTVAEYLDNTLSSERVADFEKVCLESDVYLAEVACCHQVLALVLGEPAEVDPAGRERMYNIPAALEKRVEEAQHTEAPSEKPIEKPQPAPRRKIEVPEYLRDEPPGVSRVWRVAAMLLLALLLAGVVVMALRPDSLSELFTGSREVASSDGDGEPAQGDNAAGAADGTVADAGGTEDATTDGGTADGGTADGGATDGAAADGGTDGQGGGAAPGEPGGAPPVTPEANGGAAPVDPLPTEPPVRPVTPAGPGETATAPETTDPHTPVVPPVPAPEETRENVGQLTSPNTVLFRFNPQLSAWSRMPALGTLTAGDLLISPPAFRNTISLRGGITMQLLGDSQVELLKSDAGSPPHFRLAHGRAVLMTVGEANTTVMLRAGDRDAQVTLGAAGSAMALDVQSVPSPGTDPESARPEYRTEVFAASGSLVWDEEPSGKRYELTAPSRVTLGDDQPQPVNELPEWIARQQLSLLERKAAESVEQYLRDELAEKLQQGLMELAGHRRSEIKSLAIRCLAAIGQFDWVVATLKDPDMRGVWGEQIEALRRAVDRGPDLAALVRQAIVDQRGEATGAELYRMLWGYTAKDLTEGGHAEKLVNALDHADLDMRVLASWNLRDITKSGGVLYQPTDTPIQRRPYVNRWRQKLESGQIVPQEE